MKRFWAKVDIRDKDDCWEWKAGKGGKYSEYGMFWNSSLGRMENAHRMSYRLTYGEILSTDIICHKCDNPGCVNPNHLYLGDKCSNAADCKGNIGRISRWYEGELWLIRRIYSRGIKQHIISRMFKVNQSTISDILKDLNYPYKGMNRYALNHMNER